MIVLWYTLMGFDFDEVLMVCMGFAGLAYIVVDLKRERRLDQFAVAICEDIATLKAVLGEGNPHPLNERVASIESALETFDPTEMRERVASIEARIDHKPITHTRAKGKFVSPQALQDEIDALRAELARKSAT